MMYDVRMKTKSIAKEIAEASPKNSLIVEVISSTVYLFPNGEDKQYESQKQFIDEWFIKYPLSRYHASRDGAKVGFSEKVIKVKALRGKI